MTPWGALSPVDGLTVEVETWHSPERNFEFSFIGPLGTGHGFEVGISWEEDGQRRGVCLMRSEQGLRYVALRDLKVKEALVELMAAQQDENGDGAGKLVLVEDAWVGSGGGDPAITATAYDWSGTTLQLDRQSTQKLRAQLAVVYERAAESEKADPGLRQYYGAAAAHLRSPICLLEAK